MKWRSVPTRSVPAGSGGSAATLVGVLNVNTTSAATTGTVEEILATYTLPGGTLDTNGRGIRITVGGSHAANTNSAGLAVRFGGIGGTIVAPQTNGVTSNGSIRLVAEILRTGATSQVSNGMGWVTTTFNVTQAAPSQTLANNIDIVVTGTSPTSAGDITFKQLIVEMLT